MAQFNSLTLTDAGIALQIKAQTGTPLQFIRVAVGDGIVSDDMSLERLTGLISEKLSVAISNLSISNGTATLKANFSNESVTESFYIRELGVFANDPDNGEILYAVANTGDKADYLPAYGGTEVIEQVFTIALVVDSAAAVTATFAESIYVLKAGDTMTGPLILSGDPTANLQAVTKQYVDKLSMTVVPTLPIDDTAQLTEHINGLAQQIQNITGVDDWKAAPDSSIQTIMNAFNTQLLGTNGYQKLPGRLILQWGRILCSSSSSQIVTFSVAFPTACYNISISENGASSGTADTLIKTFSNSSFTVAEISTSNYIMWSAIGY